MAQEPNCTERVKDCESLLQQADDLIKSKKQIISKQDEQIAKQLEIFKAQESYVHELESSNRSWYRNPWITVPLGMISGVLLYRELRK